MLLCSLHNVAGESSAFVGVLLLKRVYESYLHEGESEVHLILDGNYVYNTRTRPSRHTYVNAYLYQGKCTYSALKQSQVPSYSLDWSALARARAPPRIIAQVSRSFLSMLIRLWAPRVKETEGARKRSRKRASPFSYIISVQVNTDFVSWHEGRPLPQIWETLIYLREGTLRLVTNCLVQCGTSYLVIFPRWTIFILLFFTPRNF